jgi:hypothetical protein
VDDEIRTLPTVDSADNVLFCKVHSAKSLPNGIWKECKELKVENGEFDRKVPITLFEPNSRKRNLFRGDPANASLNFRSTKVLWIRTFK